MAYLFLTCGIDGLPGMTTDLWEQKPSQRQNSDTRVKRSSRVFSWTFLSRERLTDSRAFCSKHAKCYKNGNITYVYTAEQLANPNPAPKIFKVFRNRL